MNARLPNIHPLHALGIDTDAQALLCVPREYIDGRIMRRRLQGAATEQFFLWTATLVKRRGYTRDKVATRSPKPYRLVLTWQLEDATVESSIMGSTFIWASIPDKTETEFIAKVVYSPYTGLLTFKNFDLNITPHSRGHVVSRCVGVQGQVSGMVIDACVQTAVASDSYAQCGQLLEHQHDLKAGIVDSGYTDCSSFLKTLHRPMTLDAGHHAIEVARKISIVETQARAQRVRVQGVPQGTVVQLPSLTNYDEKLIPMVRLQSEKLSNGQREALNKIRLGVKAAPGSLTLLNGDVGSGKTLVFLLAAAAVSECGHRTCIMAPNDLIAQQIAREATVRFPHLSPGLVTAQSYTVTEKTMMLIGTQALLHRAEQLAPPESPLGMLVIDEQHKFSVEQRSLLAGMGTHVIEASATPIPRSLALALFKGWKEARIVGCPVSKTITSHLLLPSHRHVARQFVRKHLSEGKRIIFLYHSVAKGESSAIEACQRMETRFPGQIALVHGRLKGVQKSAALDRFRCGEAPILIATTAVEVGIDVPDVGCMIVCGADHFGIAQLHQLRGRLARNGGFADFVMLTDKEPKQNTHDRLVAVRDTSDGFELAERDLHLRGFGEVMGEAQVGSTGTTFKLLQLEPKDFLGDS